MHNFTLDYVKNIQYPVFILNIVNKLQIYIINKMILDTLINGEIKLSKSEKMDCSLCIKQPN